MFKKVQLLGLLFVLSLVPACSDSENENTIEKQTDKIAQEAVDSIKTPIEQSKVAVEALNKRNEAVNNSTEKVEE